MLINGFSLLQMVERNRVVYIMGRTGGGKTALAFRIAYHLAETGFCRYIFSNCASVWSDPLEDIIADGDFLDLCVILDEGGQFLKFGKDAERFLNYLRKFNVTILVPSASEPSSKMRTLVVQRTFDFSIVGVPLWLYNVQLAHGRVRDRSWFGWLGPSEIFGTYDSSDTPIDDCGISDLILAHQELVIKRRGHGKHRRGAAVQIQDLAGVGGQSQLFGGQSPMEYSAELMAEAAEKIGESVSLLEHASRGKRSRRSKN